MKNILHHNSRFSWLWKVAALVGVLLVCLFPFPRKTENGSGRYALSANAASGDVMRIDRYEVTATVREDRKIEFEETITMTANLSGSVFTRSLPLESDRYYNITASCVEVGDGFTYSVLTDEEGEYLCVDCELPAKIQSGQSRTFKISYTMEIGRDDVPNGMLLDVVGYGWGVALHDVRATLRFPAPIGGDYEVWSGGYGATGNAMGVESELSDDGKTLTLTAEQLDVVYNDAFNERMAAGITVRFVFGEGVLDNYVKTRIFTDDIWKILLGGVAVIALAAVSLIFTRKKRDMVRIVNIKAPDDMDPMRMGKLIDGTVDGEDVTSMIYYFAHKGYLMINLENEDDPVLIRKVVSLPENASVYEKTLFNGLFLSGDTANVSSLKNKFYSSVDKATKQVPSIPMYEKKSVFGFVSGGLLGTFFSLAVLFLTGKFKVGGGYTNVFGIFMAVPVFIIVFIAALRENHRYKWKRGMQTGLLFAEILVAVVFSLFFLLFQKHVLTEYEKILLCVCSFAATFITLGALSRTEKYTDVLGEILGFKDFIVVTEEEKIKFMLEENPELYYKVLPYAQVLGVTDEWENKFKDVLVQPPQWCTGTNVTVFDYMILNRCINRAMITAMTRPQSSGNGSFAGRSGGGGSFGGFGGGGHGGGGGGWR